MQKPLNRLIIALIIVIALIGVTSWLGWNYWKGQSGDSTSLKQETRQALESLKKRFGPEEREGMVNGNGRIEATEIDAATKLGGMVEEILVKEGAFVTAGQVVAQMQTNSLEAQLEQANAHLQQAINAVSTAKIQVAQRESDLAIAQANVTQQQSELDNANRRMARSRDLSNKGMLSRQQYDDDAAAVNSLQAAVTAAKVQVQAARTAIEAARVGITGAEKSVDAAEANVKLIRVNIADSQIKAPRDGRVQYLVAQPGEVLGAGSKLLNMIDISDVYMTFFLPETVAGRVAIDSDVHLVLDAAPDYVIPAKVSFVSSVAQFTPKTVETASERQKLMFKVKARIDPDLLKQHKEKVKTGLPGIAWIKLDPTMDWPEELVIRVSNDQ